MIRRIVFALLALLTWGSCRTAGADEALARKIEEFAGSPVRMVWLRDNELVFLDTAQGAIEVARNPGPAPSRPIITPSGKQVVFICFDEWASYAVNWDGSGLTKLVDGRITHVRMDETGAEWAYWQTRSHEMRTARLTDMTNSTVVWKFAWPPRDGKTENFQTSADGKRACSNIPWPQIGIACLPQKGNESFIRIGIGCWPQIARDNSYMVYYLHGGKHDKLAMFDGAASRSWFVPCLPNPKRTGCETPRWSNDARFLVGTDQHYSQSLPDIYLARFSADFSALNWLRITTQGDNDEPDAWIASAAKPPAPATIRAEIDVKIAAGREGSWPGVHRGLSFIWEDINAANEIRGDDGKVRRDCRAVLKQRARPSQYNSARLTDGVLMAEGLPDDFHAELKQNNAFTFEAVANTLTRASNGVIAWYGPTNGPCNFMIEKDGAELVLTVRTADPAVPNGARRLVLGPAPIRLPVKPGDAMPLPPHILVALGNGKATYYVDGKTAGTVDGLAGDLTVWQPGVLLFGNRPDGAANWDGRIEAIALHNRTLGPEDAMKQYGLFAKKLNFRNQIRPQKTTGRLLETSPVPQLKDIQPYPRALVAYSYELPPDRDGKPRRAQVLHWVWLDNQRVPLDYQKGQEYPLLLEPVDAHPYADPAQNASERVVNNLTDIDSRLYVDVGR